MELIIEVGRAYKRKRFAPHIRIYYKNREGVYQCTTTTLDTIYATEAELRAEVEKEIEYSEWHSEYMRLNSPSNAFYNS